MLRIFLPLLLLATALLIGAEPALAQYEEGQQAFDAGDYDKARAAWQKGAEGNDPKSLYSLGYLCQFGLGGPADPGQAQTLYEKAAAAHNPDALYALGLIYERGEQGERDLAKALDYYRQSAGAGTQPDAEYAIGRMLLRGRGAPRDPKESVRWLKKSALHGNPAAQYLLAASYEAGWGVPVDPGEAYYWYRRAESGDPVALQEQDTAFQPKIAIAALKKRLPLEEIEELDERVEHDTAASKPKPTAKGNKDALTKPAR